MKKLLLLFFTILSFSAFGGTCSTLTRSNYVTQQVLTSTALNADFNNILTQINDLDGGCITDGTLEKAALDSSEFSAPWDSFKDGCSLEYSSASTLIVGACRLAVDGEWISVATSSVSMGCGDCSSETASTVYYVYAKDGSSGGTLNLYFSTVAPTDSHGEDGSSNKVLGKVYNDSNSNIEPTTIQNWHVNSHVPEKTSGVLAHVEWPATTNCSWSRASAEYADFTADADCDDNARICYGPNLTTNCAAANSDGQVPHVTVSAIPKGQYKVIVQGLFYNPTASSQCAFRVTDGSKAVGHAIVYSTGGELISNGLTGFFYYATDQGSTTFKLQASRASGSPTCTILMYPASAASLGLSITIEKLSPVY